jgi:hypothetical protein
MEYVPVEAKQIPERRPADIDTLTSPAVIRRLRICSYLQESNVLLLVAESVRLPLAIAKTTVMTFGTESITALDYLRRVLERYDQVDAIVLPQKNGHVPLTMFWVHIEYVGTPLQARSYSKKDDGLFAMRAKSGEKAERIVTRELREKYNHKFAPQMCDSPGFFEIRYAGKKQRKPDRKCLACGLLVEIKKRNKDTHFRVSHSDGRTFESENTAGGWHAFVFPDMKPRFVSNAAIAQAIRDNRHVPGPDQYDSWSDVDGLASAMPPTCCG